MGQKSSLSLSEEDVQKYLERHPDFLARHPELFATLVAPSRFKDPAQKGKSKKQASGVVDIQSVILQQLQKEVQRLQQDQQKVVQSTRRLLSLQKKIHAAVDCILASTHFEHFIHNLTREMALHLEIDLVSVAIESEHVEISGIRTSGIQLLPEGFIDDYMGAQTRLLIDNNISGDPAFYASGAGLVCSEVLIRLQISPRCPAAVLALGSRLSRDFESAAGQEPLFLFLGSCVSHLLRAWLDLPPY